uniref:Uncharacterized protein n=1 Tax=Rhizophora mucronata TaxID=61149 RepID=A0A2P2QXW8_RHIMU
MQFIGETGLSLCHMLLLDWIIWRLVNPSGDASVFLYIQ